MSGRGALTSASELGFAMENAILIILSAPDSYFSDGMVRNARQGSAPPRPQLTAKAGEIYCWTIKPSKGVAPKRWPSTSLTSSRGYPESGPGVQVRPPSLL
jgi:hypothetical protein